MDSYGLSMNALFGFKKEVEKNEMVAGAALVKLAVYLKGKNAKKYRQGVEYGSARWSA